MGVKDYDLNPDNNTQINGINIAEGCPPSGINNAIRQLMADVKADSDAQNEKASTLATASDPGIVKPGTGMSVDTAGALNVDTASTSKTGIVQLNNTVTSTSTTQAATANAAKIAYDKAVEAKNSADDAIQNAENKTTPEQVAEYGAPDFSKVVSISITTSFDYVVPVNGYIKCYSSLNTGGYIYIHISKTASDDYNLYYAWASCAPGYTEGGMFPVSKGTYVKRAFSGVKSFNAFFIPAKGENWNG